MRIRILCLLFCLAFTLPFLTGCLTGRTEVSTTESVGITSSISEDSSAESSSIESSLSDDTSSAPSSNDKVEQPDDFFTENGQGFLPEAAVLPALSVKTHTEFLYELDLELPELALTNTFDAPVNPDLRFYFGSDTVHVAYTSDARYYRVLSAENGKLLTEMTLPEKANAGALDGGGFWVVHYDGLTVNFYDQNGTESSILKKDTAYQDRFTPSYAAVSTDGKTVLAAFEKGTPFVMLDIESGEKMQIESETKAETWDLLTQTDDVFLFAGDRGSLLRIDLESKTYEQLTTEDPVDDVDGGLYRLADVGMGMLLRGEDDGVTKLFAAFFEGEAEIALEFGFGYCATADNGTFRFYDLRESVLTAEFVLGERYYEPAVTFTDSGAVFITALYWGEPICYVYDLPAAVREAEELASLDTRLLDATSIAGIVTEYADAVGDKHGIEIYCGSEGNDFIIDGYVAVVEKEPLFLYDSLQTVDRILSRYPDGMLEEIYGDVYSGLRFYLCGSIYGYGEDGLDQAGGFTTVYDNCIVIVIDLYNGLETTLPHELSHAFDYRIKRASAALDTDWLALFETVTPYDDAYLYTYENYHRAENYTVYGETNKADIWFVDSYGRTYPTEDRARLMECMFAEDGDYMADLLTYENLGYKARLYCYILRQCFESCDTEEALFWEQHLGIPDAEEFEVLLQSEH